MPACRLGRPGVDAAHLAPPCTPELAHTWLSCCRQHQPAAHAALCPPAGGKSQLADNAKAMSIVCNVCRQSFLCNMTAAKLKEHTDSKHAKLPFEQCFPGFTESA